MSWRSCYAAPTPPEAHLVKGFLEQRGVPCLLQTNGPTPYPSVAFGHRVHVLVPEDWLPVARKLVDRPTRRARRPMSRVVPFRTRSRRR